MQGWEICGPRSENAHPAEVLSKRGRTDHSFGPVVDGAPAHASSLPSSLHDLSGENAVQSAWLWSQKEKETGRARGGIVPWCDTDTCTVNCTCSSSSPDSRLSLTGGDS